MFVEEEHMMSRLINLESFCTATQLLNFGARVSSSAQVYRAKKNVFTLFFAALVYKAIMTILLSSRSALLCWNWYYTQHLNILQAKNCPPKKDISLYCIHTVWYLTIQNPMDWSVTNPLDFELYACKSALGMTQLTIHGYLTRPVTRFVGAVPLPLILQFNSQIMMLYTRPHLGG